jgi:hypothetical protein
MIGSKKPQQVRLATCLVRFRPRRQAVRCRRITRGRSSPLVRTPRGGGASSGNGLMPSIRLRVCSIGTRTRHSYRPRALMRLRQAGRRQCGAIAFQGTKGRCTQHRMSDGPPRHRSRDAQKLLKLHFVDGHFPRRHCVDGVTVAAGVERDNYLCLRIVDLARQMVRLRPGQYRIRGDDRDGCLGVTRKAFRGLVEFAISPWLSAASSDAAGRLRRQPLEHVAHVGVGSWPLSRPKWNRLITAAARLLARTSGEQPLDAAQRDRPDLVLTQLLPIDRSPVVEEPRQRRPAVQAVVDRPCGGRAVGDILPLASAS